MEDTATDKVIPYRVIRVLVYPGRHALAVSVVARTVSGRHQRDHLVWRGSIPTDPDVRTGAELLRAAADALSTAAESI